MYVQYNVVECQVGLYQDVKPECGPAGTDLPQLNDREDQISHETVNLGLCSIVWKGIKARSTNPEAERDKY